MLRIKMFVERIPKKITHALIGLLCFGFILGVLEITKQEALEAKKENIPRNVEGSRESDIVLGEKAEKELQQLVTSVQEELRFLENKLLKEGAASGKKRVPKATPLANTGNSCYLNSILQTLFSFPELREEICSIPILEIFRLVSERSETQDEDGEISPITDQEAANIYIMLYISLLFQKVTHSIPVSRSLLLNIKKFLIQKSGMSPKNLHTEQDIDLPMTGIKKAIIYTLKKLCPKRKWKTLEILSDTYFCPTVYTRSIEEVPEKSEDGSASETSDLAIQLDQTFAASTLDERSCIVFDRKNPDCIHKHAYVFFANDLEFVRVCLPGFSSKLYVFEVKYILGIRLLVSTSRILAVKMVENGTSRMEPVSDTTEYSITRKERNNVVFYILPESESERCFVSLRSEPEKSTRKSSSEAPAGVRITFPIMITLYAQSEAEKGIPGAYADIYNRVSGCRKKDIKKCISLHRPGSSTNKKSPAHPDEILYLSIPESEMKERKYLSYLESRESTYLFMGDKKIASMPCRWAEMHRQTVEDDEKTETERVEQLVLHPWMTQEYHKFMLEVTAPENPSLWNQRDKIGILDSYAHNGMLMTPHALVLYKKLHNSSQPESSKNIEGHYFFALFRPEEGMWSIISDKEIEEAHSNFLDLINDNRNSNAIVRYVVYKQARAVYIPDRSKSEFVKYRHTARMQLPSVYRNSLDNPPIPRPASLVSPPLVRGALVKLGVFAPENHVPIEEHVPIDENQVPGEQSTHEELGGKAGGVVPSKTGNHYEDLSGRKSSEWSSTRPRSIFDGSDSFSLSRYLEDLSRVIEEFYDYPPHITSGTLPSDSESAGSSSGTTLSKECTTSTTAPVQIANRAQDTARPTSFFTTSPKGSRKVFSGAYRNIRKRFFQWW